jgi:NAD(P)-dependent dehydrogenase (short-subunit alcohol dehydrogenase family)
MMDRFADKNALVTGAASGIGRATAIRFASEGARVALLDQNAEGLEDTAHVIHQMNGEAFPLAVDLTIAADVERVVGEAVRQLGSLHAAFNGAGGSGRRWGDGPVDACTVEGWERTIAVNLTSMFLVCKHVVPPLLETRGAIVNLSSVLGLVGGDEDFATHAYAASKSGIIGMSRAMASYYAPRGLRVNVIAPGLIATAMSQRAQSDPHIQSRLPQLQPLTGAMGEPEDIAAAAAYLASDDARFVTGAVLTVDGGWTMR